jgi:hypothetical protein
MKIDVTVSFLTLIAIFGIAWLFFGQRRMMVPIMPDATMPDYWGTPYYLRYNTPVPDSTAAIMPTQAVSGWSLSSRI